jgi:type I restriction enzyme S subunit
MATEYFETGVPFLRSLNVDPFTIKLNDVKYIDKEFHERLKKSALRPGDVVIVRTGKPGACAVIPDWLPEANCSDLVIVRCGEGLDPRYLMYSVNSTVVRHVNAHLVGAVQQHFNVGSARAIELQLPPIEEQRAIVRVLGALDDKIELNRKMNRTLEELARAIFKSWFVDFDPVHAKAASQQPIGMDAETAALFPDSFQDSPLGPIPAGWCAKSLDQIATFTNGLAMQKYPPAGDEWLPVIKIAQLKKGSAEGADRASTDIPATARIDDGDLLFSWSGSLETTVWTGGPGALNQHLFKVESEEFPQWFVHEWIKEHLPWFQSIAAHKATTMGHIQRTHLTEAMVAVPPADLVAADCLVGKMADLSLSRSLESKMLAQTRDLLLPKLLSGEVRIQI